MPQRPSAARRLLLRALPGVAAVAFAALAFHAPQAAAQAYPDKPVKIVVGFPPGGTNDILARLVAEKQQGKWRQSFIVENRPDAASANGNDLVAKAAPDGYTLHFGAAGNIAINPSLFANMPFDPQTDFAPVALASTAPPWRVAWPSSSTRPRSVRDMSAATDQRP